MQLDLRLPMGIMFSIFGVVAVVLAAVGIHQCLFGPLPGGNVDEGRDRSAGLPFVIK